MITLTTLLGSCHSYHIHTISPISLTIFSLSRRLRTTVGQSPNIHTKLMGSWRGHRNHRSLLCLDWTHSLWTSCTLQNPILELGPNSSSGRGGRMWCGILWLRKERVEWGWCVVRPSKSFIQSPTLWAWPAKFIGGLKVMQSAVTNTVFMFSTRENFTFSDLHWKLIYYTILPYYYTDFVSLARKVYWRAESHAICSHKHCICVSHKRKLHFFGFALKIYLLHHIIRNWLQPTPAISKSYHMSLSVSESVSVSVSVSMSVSERVHFF